MLTVARGRVAGAIGTTNDGVKDTESESMATGSESAVERGRTPLSDMPITFSYWLSATVMQGGFCRDPAPGFGEYGD
jgi:hypothetical protein